MKNPLTSKIDAESIDQVVGDVARKLSERMKKPVKVLPGNSKKSRHLERYLRMYKRGKKK